MNEQQWLSATWPYEMLRWLRDSGKLTNRKLRLFAAACCRRVWPLLTDERSRTAVEVGERYADRLAPDVEVDDAREDAADACGAAHTVGAAAGWSAATWIANAAANAAYCELFYWEDGFFGSSLFETPIWAGRAAARPAVEGVESNAAQPTGLECEGRGQCYLLRDIFGNPFRPLLPLAPSLLRWNASAVVQLASAAYEERILPEGHLDLACLAVLADALEEAGCATPEILAHLRSPGPHVRGCHVLDAIFGRD
jgi:hypothetical protein